jgi:hypothetical protein
LSRGRDARTWGASARDAPASTLTKNVAESEALNEASRIALKVDFACARLEPRLFDFR